MWGNNTLCFSHCLLFSGAHHVQLNVNHRCTISPKSSWEVRVRELGSRNYDVKRVQVIWGTRWRC